jgi:hypothetical protein
MCLLVFFRYDTYINDHVSVLQQVGGLIFSRYFGFLTNKTEILLKMALNTITLTNFPSLKGPCNNFP